MKKKISLIFVSVLCSALICGCSGKSTADGPINDKPSTGTVQEAEPLDGISSSDNVISPDDIKPEENDAGIPSDPDDNELGWDGEWTGDGVSVTINGAGEDWITVDIADEEMHTSLDEVSIDGNTLTGIYRITLEMYDDPEADLPEQEWTITMVKDGAHASYSRTAVLTWFSLNEDGTYGHTITKENSASLTLTTVSNR